MTIKNYILGVAALTMLAACGGDKKTEETAGVGIDINNIDSTEKPQENFYLYANGNWLKKNPVPSTESRWGSFSVLNEDNLKKLREILDETAKQKNANGSNAQKIGDYYFAAMDSVKKNAEGVKPLASEIEKINSLKSNNDIMKTLAELQLNGTRALFGIYVGQDPKISDQNIAQANQSGLGMPDRDYYTKSDEESKALQSAYKEHLVKMFMLLGDAKDVAEKNAKIVYEFETRLAKASMTNVELRDIEKQYNKWGIAELNKKYPNMKWPDYLNQVGLTTAKEVIIGQPSFFKEVDAMLKSSSIDSWKIYLRWWLINSAADNLSDEIAAQNFAFYGTILSGQKQQKPRWKRTLTEIDGAMGEALGQLFVEKYFKPESKARVNEMVDNLMIAYKERIEQLDWMSAETKEKAKKKLTTIIRKLGYPDTWRDYSAMEVSKDSHFKNATNAYKFELKRNFDKLGKPVDKMEWLMSPPTVNAYYQPTTNEITFPAGIMQPPFFFSKADDAVNYAGIGAVIGHELTHGFDDQGSQFDEMGNLKNWWTEEDKKKFEVKTKMVVQQYSNYIAIDSLHVNGELTLGENIADFGGIMIAYQAFKKTKQGKSTEKIDGLSPEQRFFMSWANIWRSNYTPEALKKQVNTNPHSPAMFRANGPISNMKEFYDAFGIKEGDKMWRAENERIKIW
jgi:putative endopeptidase